MRIAVIAFSGDGALLAKQLSGLSELGHEVKGYIAQRHAEGTSLLPFASVYSLAARLFETVEALVFISACGIAVRAVAPLIKNKLTDPAVVACGETGRFAVSLLSGHAGGANELTRQIASLIGAIPVITTASDSHSGLEQTRNLVLGIGCRRGFPAETIERIVTILLWDQKIPLSRIIGAATIDVKRDEEGLIGFAKAHKIPMYFYTSGELEQVQGEFSSSERVLRVVGVDNVCERAAVLCGARGKLILRKTTRDGVSIAVFEKE
jgi:cobalt-precorrin 5A hydrolase